MKISRKISILVVFLLLVLSVNSFIGVFHISKVGRELNDVAHKNISLTEIITTISQLQLEKTVLLERMIRISEEMNSEEVIAARQQHLIDHSIIVKDGFDQLAEAGAVKIIEGKEIIESRLKDLGSKTGQQELQRSQSILRDIEKSHIQYDQLVGKIFESIKKADYQLSFEDIKKIRRIEKSLSEGLKSLLDQVQGFTRNSLEKAREYELISRKIIKNSLLVSIFIGAIIAWWIIRGISQPLSKLEKATKTVGEGNFAREVKIQTKDEIGTVGRAFNVMTKKLAEYKRDIEEKNKELAENLKITESQKKDLQEVNKELDQFAHTVSHDLRAPLTGIIGYETYLKKHLQQNLSEKEKDCLEGIERSALRMNDLINDLLALTKISRVRNPYEEVWLNDIVGSVVERLEFAIKELNVQLKVQENLPVLRCDRIKLGEVFLNLINNAIKFSSKSNRDPIIEIGCKEQTEAYEIFIKDNGIGIDKEHYHEIFGVFKRLHNIKEYDGTGVGLSVVKTVVEEHGGKVWVDSKLGTGSTFYFTISKNL